MVVGGEFGEWGLEVEFDTLVPYEHRNIFMTMGM